MKITFLQIEQAFVRAVYGESARAIAGGLGVTEGCLRFHFRKGPSPRQVRQLAFELCRIKHVRASLTPAENKAVDRLAAKARATT